MAQAESFQQAAPAVDDRGHRRQLARAGVAAQVEGMPEVAAVGRAHTHALERARRRQAPGSRFSHGAAFLSSLPRPSSPARRASLTLWVSSATSVQGTRDHARRTAMPRRRASSAGSRGARRPARRAAPRPRARASGPSSSSMSSTMPQRTPSTSTISWSRTSRNRSIDAHRAFILALRGSATKSGIAANAATRDEDQVEPAEHVGEPAVGVRAHDARGRAPPRAPGSS